MDYALMFFLGVAGYHLVAATINRFFVKRSQRFAEAMGEIELAIHEYFEQRFGK